MRKKISALLLAALMLAALCVPAYAAPAAPSLELEGEVNASGTTLTVCVADASGATNGRIAVEYDAGKLTFAGAEPGDEGWVTSVNSETEGTVWFAWVGSGLTAEKTALCSLTFNAKGGSDQVTYTARVEELYASGVSLLSGGAVEESITLPARRADPPLPPSPAGPGSGPDEPEPSEPVFRDVPDGFWAKEDIEAAADKGWLIGTGDGRFDPDEIAGRGQFATIIWRMQGKPEPKSGSPFTDVARGSYYEESVTWCAEAGVMNGTSPDKASPEDTVKRQEAVAMLCRYAKYLGIDTAPKGGLAGFTDAGSVADWAKDNMAWAVESGLIQGVPGGALQPQRAITRAEMATLLMRFAELAGLEDK